jgi:3-dehydroquinate synthase
MNLENYDHRKNHKHKKYRSMNTVQVTIPTKQQQYRIVIGQNILSNSKDLFELDKYTKLFVVTDENIAPHFLDKLLQALPQQTQHLILPPGEKAKNLESLQKLWTAMKEANLDRKSLVINLGGGVIGDMGGFAASTYMRGIHFLQIPTTLLSQIDASVGGKTGIDFAGIKNLIGTFNQPTGVLVDTDTLKTLPKNELVSGFAEIIKHGLLADKAYFEKVTSKKPEEFSQEELVDIITGSCEIKKRIVESDVMESGQRKLLNVGHTIGHAIEAVSLETNQPLLHGEAVSLGTIAESQIAEQVGILSSQDGETIKQAFQNAGLPTSLRDHEVSKQSTQTIVEKMQSDKKNAGGKINFTLLKTIGSATINNHVSDGIIEQAIHSIFND